MPQRLRLIFEKLMLAAPPSNAIFAPAIRPASISKLLTKSGTFCLPRLCSCQADFCKAHLCRPFLSLLRQTLRRLRLHANRELLTLRQSRIDREASKGIVYLLKELPYAYWLDFENKRGKKRGLGKRGNLCLFLWTKRKSKTRSKIRRKSHILKYEKTKVQKNALTGTLIRDYPSTKNKKTTENL